MNNLAPVYITTLNRYMHFKKCIESLSECIHADKTDLFIALDYPLNESHWEGYELIKAFLPTIKGFRTVTIIEREINYGPRKNSMEAKKFIFEKYDRLILSEDDNVSDKPFAPQFLHDKRFGMNFASPIPNPQTTDHSVFQARVIKVPPWCYR